MSMIYDYYGRQGTASRTIPWPTGVPASLPWSETTFSELKEILRRLDSLDKKLGLEHCEDPKKAEWMKSIEDRLKKLETQDAKS